MAGPSLTLPVSRVRERVGVRVRRGADLGLDDPAEC